MQYIKALIPGGSSQWMVQWFLFMLNKSPKDRVVGPLTGGTGGRFLGL